MTTMPMAAATGAAQALTDLFVVLLAAKAGDELFKRLGQPTIVGEILAGVLVGPAVLGLVAPTDVLEVFAELGVVFLLFWVGLETRLSDLRAVGPTAAATGVLGLILPLTGGVALGLALGEHAATTVFLGAALVATSVGITSAVLQQLGVLAQPASRTILGAAIVDDVLAMIVLAVAVGLASEGGVDALGLVVTIALALGFVVFVAVGGTRLMQRMPDLLRRPRFSESPLLPAVVLCLGLAALSAQIGLAAIIGAFLAGLVVAESPDREDLEAEVAPLYAFLPPFFFVFIGLQVDLGALSSIGALALLAAVTAVAVVTKALGAWLGARRLGRRPALVVAAGMVPRGEVGIVVAGIGIVVGALDERLFAIVVAMSIITTVAVPPVLRRLLEHAPGIEPGATHEPTTLTRA
ncbi:MAG TPA: cation:proton antiporter [Baekduia sp.]|nr:cation:proton antiporter [Baekduia sp.]